MINSMSLEKQNIDTEIQENPENKKLQEALTSNLQNPEDKKIAWEILGWFKWDPNLSNEQNFRAAYNQEIDSLLSQHFQNLEPEKVQALTALKSQEAEGKNPQQLIESYTEVLSIISTDMAEANKNTTDMLAQKNQAIKNWEAQKATNFIEELKQRGQEAYDKAQQQKEALKKEHTIFQASNEANLDEAFTLWLLTPEKSPEAKS